jgi:hypothetical protein
MHAAAHAREITVLRTAQEHPGAFMGTFDTRGSTTDPCGGDYPRDLRLEARVAAGMRALLVAVLVAG